MDIFFIIYDRKKYIRYWLVYRDGGCHGFYE